MSLVGCDRLLRCGHLCYTGYVGGTFNNGNAYTKFVTAPQIYTPTAPLGQRWSGLLIDSGIDRGYHNSAVLIASGEVCSTILFHIEHSALSKP